MGNNKKIFLGFILLAVFLIAPFFISTQNVFAATVTAFDTTNALGAGATNGDLATIWSNTWFAQAFIVSQTGTINRLTIQDTYSNPATYSFAVKVYTAAADGTIGTQVGTFGANPSYTTFDGKLVFTPSSTYTLNANTTYWILGSVSSGGGLWWKYTNAAPSAGSVPATNYRAKTTNTGSTYIYDGAINSGGYGTNYWTFNMKLTMDVTPDTVAPVLSAASVTTTSNTATVTWTTDETASTLVNFGLSSSYGTSTAETDTSPRVTSHTAVLSGLVPCTKYHYQIRSKDAANNTSTSTDGTFSTIGCAGEANILSTEQDTVSVSEQKTLTNGSLTLTVPAAFTTATTSAIFQASQIEGASFHNLAGAPSGKTAAGSSIFHLTALSDATTTISVFDAPISVTLSYLDSDVAGLDESSLEIYRYDSSVWHALNNCAVDQNANTVTCDTSNFSDFALFGDPVVSTASVSNSPSGTSISRQIANLKAMGNDELAQKLIAEYQQPATVSQTEQKIPTSQKPETERDLDVGDSGDDVMALQKFLIEKMSGPSAKQLERVGTTGYFGIYTKNALGEFQFASGIRPHSGYFGPITKNFIKQIAPLE